MVAGQRCDLRSHLRVLYPTVHLLLVLVDVALSRVICPEPIVFSTLCFHNVSWWGSMSQAAVGVTSGPRGGIVEAVWSFRILALLWGC